MSGEAVLVPLVWESITGVAGAVQAAVEERKEAARRQAEAQRERVQAWRVFQARQNEAQSQLSRTREAVHQAHQRLINSGLQEAAARADGGPAAEGFIAQGTAFPDQRVAGLMAQIAHHLDSLPAELCNDERLPFERLRTQLQRMQQAATVTLDEVFALNSTLQRTFEDHVQRIDREAIQARKHSAAAQQLLTQILAARELAMDDNDDEALARLQDKLLALLAEQGISAAALDVIGNSLDTLRAKVERGMEQEAMNGFLAGRVTHHLNEMGYTTVTAFTEQQAGKRRDAEFALPDGDRVRVALQADSRIGFQLTHETGTMIEKTLSGEALSFFRRQEARWCGDMKELMRRLVKDGVAYEVQFERDVPDESIPVVVMESVDELLDEDEEDRRRRRAKKERNFT